MNKVRAQWSGMGQAVLSFLSSLRLLRPNTFPNNKQHVNGCGKRLKRALRTEQL